MSETSDHKGISLREADERAAPWVIGYIGLVIVWLVAVLAWVYWWRGYA
jgi:hypothetical protein